MIPPKVRVVVFDAIGTLLLPEPAVATTYARIGQRFGSRVGVEEAEARFRRAFQHEETEDKHTGLRTSEVRERERWRRIVGYVCEDATDKEACFNELFTHFGQASAWKCSDDAKSVLNGLRSRGYRLGLASNWDARLRQVAAGKHELQGLEHLTISSEVGWRKPSSHFFEALVAAFKVTPDQILFVGDDPVNDYGGARVVGMRALLLDPTSPGTYPIKPCISRLSDLLGSAA